MHEIFTILGPILIIFLFICLIYLNLKPEKSPVIEDPASTRPETVEEQEIWERERRDREILEALKSIKARLNFITFTIICYLAVKAIKFLIYGKLIVGTVGAISNIMR